MLNGGGGSPLATAIWHRNAYLEELQAVDPDSLDAAELGDWIKLQGETFNLAELQRARYVEAFDRRQVCVALGSITTIDWLRANTKVSAATADKQLTLARQLPDLVATVEAVEMGQIGFEHALAIAREAQDLPDSAQAELLAAAQNSDPKELRQVGQRIRHRDDPEDADRRAYRQFEKRRLRLFDLPDGMLGIEGALPAAEGMKFKLCLESLIGIPAKGDERTQEQRQADALAELCGNAIGSGWLPKIGGRVPQLTVIVRSDGAELEGVGPIGGGTLARLRDQHHVERRQVVGPKGVTLNFGRGRRIFSEAQRQESLTRYETCAGGECTVPARRCQLHHVDWWKDGGETDVHRALPLCWKHHAMVTEGGYQLAPQEGGGFKLVRHRNRSG